MRAPCIDCPEKGCGKKHDICEAYQAFVAEREMLRKEAKNRCEFTNNHYERIRRMIKRRNGRDV